MVVALAAVAMVVTVMVSETVFPHGTADLDEVAYQTQANVLRDGHLELAASRQDPSFRPFLTGIRGDKVVFKYQPEWPALIAASDALFGSSLPLRALCAAAGILVVAWLGWELTREQRVALLAAMLALASPFTWVQSASLLGYQLSFVLGTAAAAGLLRAVRVRSAAAGIGAGALIGLAALHRPFDAMLAVLPVLAFVAWDARQRKPRRVWPYVLLGGAPCAGLFAAYNAAVTGNVLRLAYGATGASDRFFFGWRASFALPGTGNAGRINYTVARAWATLVHDVTLMPRFVAFAPVAVISAGAALVKRRRDPRVWLLVAMGATVVAGYFFWWATANAAHFGIDRGLGPFYDYAAVAPLCVLAAWGATSVRLRPRTLVVLGVVGLAFAGVASTVVVSDARQHGRTRAAEVRETNVDSSGTTLVLDPPAFPGDPYLRFATDANLTAAHIVGLDVPVQRLAVVDRFANRQTYLIREFHGFGDPFGAMRRDRVRLELVHGAALVVRLRATVLDGLAGSTYLRVGDQPATIGESGYGTLTSSWPVTWTMLPSNQATMVTVGVTVGAEGASPPTARTSQWYECRFLARMNQGEVEMLTPCDGWSHYQFPNGQTALAHEDVSQHLALGVAIQP